MAHGQSPAGDLGEAAGPPGRQARPGGQGGPVPAARLALVAAAVAVVLAGVRAAVPATGWDEGPWHSRGIPLGLGLELVFIALLVAVELRRRRQPAAGQPAAGLRVVLRAALLVCVIGIPVLILLNNAGRLRAHPPRPIVPPRLRGLPTARPHAVAVSHGGGGSAALVLYVLLAAALLAAIVICVLLLRRRARDGWSDDGEIVDEGGEDEEELRRAVQSGQAALHEVDDARLAIIACYVAMEHSLARAGTVRGDAETPDELLGRAAAAGLSRGGEAARLTELFYEARFSSHPVPPQRREEARHALEVLAGGLREKASTAPASTGQASTVQASTGQASTGQADPGSAP
jgi:hypothetical protein